MGLSDNIRTTYSQASKEVQKKLDAFFARHKKLAEQKLKAVKEGKISESDYQQWLLRQMFTGQRWREKLDDITRTYVDADETARQLVGDRAKNVFATFANSTARDIQSKVGGGVSFDMYDRHTVERLLRENPQMLPEWKINEKKDYRWNAQRVQNAITQGIIQGESIPQLAKRLTSELSAGNEKHMKMFARTAMTGAQNAGRVERLHEAQDMGIMVKKKWLAAHDDRVRDAHAELDGQTVDIDEPFHSSLGDIMYPGDPTADPANVYNCRCTLTYVYDVQASRENLQEKEEPAASGFKASATLEDAIQRAQASGVTYARFDGMSVERANNILEAVGTLPRDCVPRFIGNGKDVSIVTDRPLGRRADQWYGVTYDYRLHSLRVMQLGYDKNDFEGGLIVGINTTKYKTIDQLTAAKKAEQAKYKAKTGREWFFNTDGRATAYHEMGHCFYDVRTSVSAWETSGRKSQWGKIASRWAGESDCDILKNKEEAFAEAWAAYHTRGRELPRYVEDFIRGLL